MAKYDVECPVCHTTYRVALFGPTRDREYKLENWDWTCKECKDKARQEENEKAAAANSAAGLPQLTGSEKQIAWAEKLRAERFELIEKCRAGELDDWYVDAYYGTPRRGGRVLPLDGEHFPCAIELLKQQTSAHWWIDQRDTKIGIVLGELFVSTPLAIPDVAPEQETKAEATVRPETAITETVAEITAIGNTISVKFPEKRQDFWHIVKKQLDYTWTGNCWKKTIGAASTGVEDQIAETGNTLLAAGFIIRIFDEKTRAAAVSGEFIRDTGRWIYKRASGDYSGWFAVSWKEDNQALYNTARKLPGSKWSKPAVVVRPEQFEQVLDFADMYEFNLSAGAQALAEESQRAKDAALTASVEKVEHDLPQPGRKPRKLAVPQSVEVANEFKD